MATEEFNIELAFDDSNVVASFGRVTESVEQTNQAVEDTGETISKSFSGKGVEKYTKALGDVEKETSKAAKSTKELGEQTKKTGATVNDAASSVGVLGKGFSGLRRQTQILGRALKALAANPVLAIFVLLVAAATALFKAFKSTKEGSEALAVAGAALDAVIGVLRDTVIALSKVIVNVFKDPIGSVEALGKAIKERLFVVFEGFIDLAKSTGRLLKAIVTIDFDLLKQSAAEAAEAVAQISTATTAEERKALVDDAKAYAAALIETAKAAAAAQASIEKVVNIQRQQAVARARLNKELVATRAISQDTTKSIVERLEAIEKVSAAEDKQVKAEIAAQRQLVAAIKVQNNLNDSNAADLDRLAQAQIKLANLETQSKSRLLSIDRQRITLQKQLIKEQEKAAEFELSIKRQLITDQEQLAKQSLEDEKNARDEDINNLLISEAKKKELLIQSQQILDNELAKVKADARAKEKAAEEQAANEELQAELAKINSKAELSNIELQRQQELARQIFAETTRSAEEIEAFEKEQGNKRIAEELRIQSERLKAIRQFSKDATAEEKARLDAQIALLETQLQGVGVTITEEKEKQQASGLLGLLGVSQDTATQIDALKSAVGTALNVVKEGVAERIAALQEEVDFRNQNISQIQQDLANEIELAKLGNAATVKDLQNRLAAEKAARDKAENDKKEAAKAQFAIDTALQASNLITSISSLYASLAALPFGIGVAVATALSGVLLGSFAASKVKAGQLAGFKDGGYTGNGGVSDVAGVTHGKEFVFDASTTKELGLNNMTMKQGRKHILNNILGSQNSDIAATISVNKANAKTDTQAAYTTAFMHALKGNNKQLKEIERAIKGKKTVIPFGDGKVQIEEEDINGNIKRNILNFK